MIVRRTAPKKRLASNSQRLGLPKDLSHAATRRKAEAHERAVIRETYRIVKRRAAGKCEGCGILEGASIRQGIGRLEMHHIVPRSLTRNQPAEVRHAPALCCMLCGPATGAGCHGHVTRHDVDLVFIAPDLLAMGGLELQRRLPLTCSQQGQ